MKYRMDKSKNTSTSLKTKPKKTGISKVMKRIKRMEVNVKKTHKKVERQGLPRATISIDAPLEDLPDYEEEENLRNKRRSWRKSENRPHTE